MASVLDCLLRNCFTTENDDDDDHNPNGNNNPISTLPDGLVEPPHTLTLDRYHQTASTSTYQPPDRRLLPPPSLHANNTNDDDEEEQDTQHDEDDEQHVPLFFPSTEQSAALGNVASAAGPLTTSTTSTTTGSTHGRNNNNNNNNNNHPHPRITHLFQRIRSNRIFDRLEDVFADYASAKTTTTTTSTTKPPYSHSTTHNTTTTTSKSEMLAKVSATLSAARSSSYPLPSLHPAHRFTTQSRPSTGDIPSLTSHSEVVLPGSDLQKLMSESLRSKGYGMEVDEDECVVCMEGFTEENPRMPTRCGCGVDRTYFHLPCLYRWVEWGEEGEGMGGGGGEGSEEGMGKCPSCRQVLEWDEFEIE